MIETYDAWLKTDGPVALKIREPLRPVMGKDAVFFPPTFAPDQESDDKKAGYVIDGEVCLVDSAGAQANRIEPVFKRSPYAALVPKVTIAVGERKVDLLEAGHRAADAVVRFSDLWADLQKAFLAIREEGNSAALAKIAPTSIVFGAWDSRDTQAKLPRLVESTVRAYGATPLKRAAQYFSSIEEDYRKDEGIDKESLGDSKFPAEWGLVDNPSGRVLGGVIAKGGIQREALLNLVALRALSGKDEAETQKLQRYILGLALVAFLAPAELFLRQGCLLCADGEAEREVVSRDGKTVAIALGIDDVMAYAVAAAAEFGVGAPREAVFNPEAVKDKAKQKSDKKAAKKK